MSLRHSFQARARTRYSFQLNDSMYIHKRRSANPLCKAHEHSTAIGQHRSQVEMNNIELSLEETGEDA
jgi:hypothetical protein